MKKDVASDEADDLKLIADHYRRAAEELLYAYQRNKEATRHHESGAFKAASHHAKLSKNHSFIAHEHLKEAVSKSERLKEADAFYGVGAMALSQRKDH
ncbi:MAG: hypothetical protein ACKOXU_14000 [Limnohabitans sp.]